MKLVKISHERCNEPDWGTVTFVFAPDEWDEDTIHEKLFEAQKKYMAALREYMEAPKPESSNYQYVQYDKYPDLKVSEVKEIYAKKRLEYEAWEAARRRALSPFRNFVVEEGFTYIEDYPEVFETYLDWGHHHGWPIDYEDSLYKQDGQVMEPKQRI